MIKDLDRKTSEVSYFMLAGITCGLEVGMRRKWLEMVLAGLPLFVTTHLSIKSLGWPLSMTTLHQVKTCPQMPPPTRVVS